MMQMWEQMGFVAKAVAFILWFYLGLVWPVRATNVGGVWSEGFPLAKVAEASGF